MANTEQPVRLDDRFPPQGAGSKLSYLEAEPDPKDRRRLEFRFGPQTDQERAKVMAAVEARDRENCDPERRLKDRELLKARLLKEAAGNRNPTEPQAKPK